MAELEPLLSVVDCHKGECLIRQGALDMEQYFLLDGILKRVVANKQGREMILRFADAGAMETSYAAWRLNTPAPYSIMTVTKARVAKLPLPQWAAFLDRHPDLKQVFEFEVMHLMSEIMAHTITLHLLDAPGRVLRFMRKHADLCRPRSAKRTRVVSESVGRDAVAARQGASCARGRDRARLAARTASPGRAP